MKRAIYVLILAILLITGVVLEQVYIDDTMHKLHVTTQELQVLIEDKNLEESKGKIKEVEKFWLGRESVLTIMIDHNEIEDIGKHVSFIRSYLEINDLDAALVECKLLVYRIETGMNVFNFDFENIL